MQFDFGRILFALPLLAASLAAQPSGLRAIGSPATIDQPGSYILTNDLFIPGTAAVGITITASDVSLDLNGHTITGPGNLTGTGIRISGARNVTVRNGFIVNAFMGAVAMNSANVRLDGLSIRGAGLAVAAPPPEIGIMLVQTRNAAVTNNLIYSVGLGIFVRGSGSYGNRIEGNTLTAQTNAIFGICYNPADGDSTAPQGDLITGNLIRGFPVSVQVNSTAKFNVFTANTFIYSKDAVGNENTSNIVKDNTLVKME